MIKRRKTHFVFEHFTPKFVIDREICMFIKIYSHVWKSRGGKYKDVSLSRNVSSKTQSSE